MPRRQCSTRGPRGQPGWLAGSRNSARVCRNLSQRPESAENKGRQRCGILEGQVRQVRAGGRRERAVGSGRPVMFTASPPQVPSERSERSQRSQRSGTTPSRHHRQWRPTPDDHVTVAAPSPPPASTRWSAAARRRAPRPPSASAASCAAEPEPDRRRRAGPILWGAGFVALGFLLLLGWDLYQLRSDLRGWASISRRADPRGRLRRRDLGARARRRGPPRCRGRPGRGRASRSAS